MQTIQLLSILILLANILCCIGTIQLIVAVLKHRKILHGYSLSGSFLTFVSLLIFNAVWILMSELLSFAFGIVTLAYWLFVVIFKIYYRRSVIEIESKGELK